MTRHQSTGSDVSSSSDDVNNNNASSDVTVTAYQHTWDIADNVFPVFVVHDEFVEYPAGYVKLAYSGDCTAARTHQSGWAARNANNHNQTILKKSCLGVLLCDRQCRTVDDNIVRVRPSICDKARKKQINKPCPTLGCRGRLQLRPCRGHGGYPVTHFWREVPDPRPGVTSTTILFQAKGEHDHPPPERKSLPAARTITRNKLKENRKPSGAVLRRSVIRHRDVRLSCRDVIVKQPISNALSNSDAVSYAERTAAAFNAFQPASRWPINERHVTGDVADHMTLLANHGTSLAPHWPISERHVTSDVTDHVTSLINQSTPAVPRWPITGDVGSHVTSLTNHSAPPYAVSADVSDPCSNAYAHTFPSNYVVDTASVLPYTTWNSQVLSFQPPPRQYSDEFQTTVSGRKHENSFSGAANVTSYHSVSSAGRVTWPVTCYESDQSAATALLSGPCYESLRPSRQSYGAAAASPGYHTGTAAAATATAEWLDRRCCVAPPRSWAGHTDYEMTSWDSADCGELATVRWRLPSSSYRQNCGDDGDQLMKTSSSASLLSAAAAEAALAVKQERCNQLTLLGQQQTTDFISSPTSCIVDHVTPSLPAYCCL